MSSSPAPGIVLALTAFLAPPLSVFAPLGLAPLLAVAAVALVAVGPRRILAAARPYAGLAAIFAAISAWGALSALWSPIPGHSLFEAVRFLAIAAAGLAVSAGAASLSDDAARRVGYALVAGLALAALVLQVELHSGEAIGRLIGIIPRDAGPSITHYDRGFTVLALLCWPAAASLVARRHWLAVALLALTVAATVGASISHASILALPAALLFGALAWRLPRIAAAGLLAATLLLAVAFPLVAPGGKTIESIHRTVPVLRESAIHRLAIWRFASDRIAERPLLGWGMDSSRAIPGGKTPVDVVFPQLYITLKAQAMPLHPHDAALQWRLELGLPGAALILLLLGTVLWRAASRELPGWRRMIVFAFAAAAWTMAMLSFGTWQAWWLSALWLGAALLVRLGASAQSAPSATKAACTPSSR
jgi:O-antigen ligase